MLTAARAAYKARYGEGMEGDVKNNIETCVNSTIGKCTAHLPDCNLQKRQGQQCRVAKSANLYWAQDQFC